MRTRIVVAIIVGAVVVGMTASAASHPAPALVAGGTEVAMSPWTPGQGTIEPGGRIRDWTAPFQDVLVGPAGDLAHGTGGLAGHTLENDVVFPGYAVSTTGTGYVFSTVRHSRRF